MPTSWPPPASAWRKTPTPGPARWRPLRWCCPSPSASSAWPSCWWPRPPVSTAYTPQSYCSERPRCCRRCTGAISSSWDGPLAGTKRADRATSRGRSVACYEAARRRAAEGALDALQQGGLLLFGPPVGRELLRTRAQEVLDAGQQLLAVERLDHVLVGAQLPGPREIALTGLGCEEDDSGRGG